MTEHDFDITVTIDGIIYDASGVVLSENKDVFFQEIYAGEDLITPSDEKLLILKQAAIDDFDNYCEAEGTETLKSAFENYWGDKLPHNEAWPENTRR